jgi:hypothetical protein
MEPAFIGCTIKQLPEHLLVPAMETAIAINPNNRVSPARVMQAFRQVLEAIAPALTNFLPEDAEREIAKPERLAVLTRKLWSPKGVKLTVGFPFDSTPIEVQKKIVQYANRWRTVGKGNVEFVLSNTDPQIRVNRDPQGGYYSFLGVDILSIPKNQATMNLASFTLATPESEWLRVVTHEFGHSLALPHEHARSEIIALLDPEAVIREFMRTQGWTRQEIMQQILTPLSEASIRGTPHADTDSIMTYWFSGTCTKSGKPILGGKDIDALDATFFSEIYPLEVKPPVEPPVNPPPKPNPNNGGFMDFLRKLGAIIAAVRAGDYLLALTLFLDLIKAKEAGQISDADFTFVETQFQAAMQQAKK